MNQEPNKPNQETIHPLLRDVGNARRPKRAHAWPRNEHKNTRDNTDLAPGSACSRQSTVNPQKNQTLRCAHLELGGILVQGLAAVQAVEDFGGVLACEIQQQLGAARMQGQEFGHVQHLKMQQGERETDAISVGSQWSESAGIVCQSNCPGGKGQIK